MKMCLLPDVLCAAGHAHPSSLSAWHRNDTVTPNRARRSETDKSWPLYWIGTVVGLYRSTAKSVSSSSIPAQRLPSRRGRVKNYASPHNPMVFPVATAKCWAVAVRWLWVVAGEGKSFELYSERSHVENHKYFGSSARGLGSHFKNCIKFNGLSLATKVLLRKLME